MDAAETWGLAEKLTETFDAATVLARGPKARGAIRAGGLREEWSPESESSSEVLDHLLSRGDLGGARIAVQLHGEPLPDLVDTLRLAGAHVIEVPVYRWAPPEDEAPLHRLVESVARCGVDALAFTSAPAAVSFLRTADALGHGPAVREALRGRVVAAAVGPITAGPLQREDLPVVQPERSRLGALARKLVEDLPERRGVRLPVAGHALDIRGHAVVVDGRLVALSTAAMALLRELSLRPGQVVSRRDLLAVGDGGDEHAVEVAVGRLRSGYRLAYEPERSGNWRY
jgi:uroporphyrinogen-III synthase